MKNSDLLLALGLCCLAQLSAQTLEITPNHVLVDESVVIRATGLQPNEPIAIHAQLTDGAGDTWESQAEFVADAQGAVDTSRQAPVKGSYKDVSAMGLVWSMMPAEKHVAAYRPPKDFASQSINFELLRGNQAIAHAQLEQRFIAEGVQQIKVEGKLHGALFVPSGSERYPGILVVGGSEGGAPLQKAAWLASHGYAAFALAYFRYDDLPPNLEAIPLEYFGQAMMWMLARPEVVPGKIAVVGTSRGGELALQLGSMYVPIKAVVAYVPANVRFPACCGNTSRPFAWTWKGEPLSFSAPRFRNANMAMNAAIAVENTQGPIMMISAEDDGVWPSAQMADAVVDRLKHSHFAYPVENLKYPHAGHRAGYPAIVPSWHGMMIHPVSGRMESLGGNAKGDAESSLDAIPKVLEFLQKNFKDRPAQ